MFGHRQTSTIMMEKQACSLSSRFHRSHCGRTARCARRALFRHERREGVRLPLPRHRDTVQLDMSEAANGLGRFGNLGRSEEHTSELQSLMRISYAVFCFKKKTRRNNKQ